MSKHTPGPWIWDAGYHEEPGFYSELKSQDTLVVASCDGCAIIKNEFDAALISSAPDMFEALKMSVTRENGWEELRDKVMAKIEGVKP